MIVTVTPNPRIDRTVTLPAQLVRGAVHRVQSVSTEPGGKGVNVARALTLAGLDTVAILPAGERDPILSALQSYGVPFYAVPIDGAVRTNLTITESDGTTTKINEPGAVIDEAAVKRAMVRCANYVVVVADSSKVGREEFVSFAPIDRVDALVTDAELGAVDRKQLAEHGVEVVLAGGEA